MRRTTCLAACVVLICGILARHAAADEITIGPIKDNTLYTSYFGPPPDLSNGAGPHIFSGGTNTGGPRRGLLEFDVASAIPAGSTIESVELTLHVSKSPANAMPDPFALHLLLEDWGEGNSNSGTGESAPNAGGQGSPAEPGDATWLHNFFNTSLWTVPGGVFNPAASANLIIDGTLGDHTWQSTPQLVLDVQLWLDQPELNNGWIVIGDEDPFGFRPRARRFDSRENTDPMVRPRLRVTYSTSTETCLTCPGDVNGDGERDGLDIQGFVDCVLDPGLPPLDCICANTNGDLVVDMADMMLFVQGMLNNAPCQ